MVDFLSVNFILPPLHSRVLIAVNTSSEGNVDARTASRAVRLSARDALGRSGGDGLSNRVRIGCAECPRGAARGVDRREKPA